MDNKYNVPKLDKAAKDYTPEIRFSDPLIGQMRWNWTTVSWEVVTDDYRIQRGKALLESLPIQDRMDIEFYLDEKAGP